MAEETPEGDNLETEDRPAWLPEKFKTEEAFAESYTQLERRLTEEAKQRSAYEQGYSELAAEVEQLRQAQELPDPQVAQNWLEEQWENNPLQTVAQLASQAAANAVEEKFKAYQQQNAPVQQGQLQTAAALADYEMSQLAPDWGDYRNKVTELIQQFPHLVPEQHLTSPLELRQDLMTVYQLARSTDLEQKAQSAEQRATELEQMKVQAQTVSGSQGRPMAPDQAKAEWDAIRNAKPTAYGG